VTDQTLMEVLQYAVAEAPDLGATWPSGLWSQTEVLAYLNERQNKLLKQTGLLLGVADLPAPAGQARIALPQDWLLTADVVWVSQDGYIRALERSDTYEADNALGAWEGTPGTPIVYMDYDPPALEVQIAPTPNVGGRILLLYAAQGSPLTGDGEWITLPGTFQRPVLKYSVLASMLQKDGRGKNVGKAQYCQMRESLGVQLAAILLNGGV